jgi:hypothetical protein
MVILKCIQQDVGMTEFKIVIGQAASKTVKNAILVVKEKSASVRPLFFCPMRCS